MATDFSSHSGHREGDDYTWTSNYGNRCITRYLPLDRPTAEEMEMLEGME